MAGPQSHLPTDVRRELPPVRIDGHALFEFSMKINRLIKQLEVRFGAKEEVGVPATRRKWQQPPNKPR